MKYIYNNLDKSRGFGFLTIDITEASWERCNYKYIILALIKLIL